MRRGRAMDDDDFSIRGRGVKVHRSIVAESERSAWYRAWGVRESRVVSTNQWPEWLKAAVVLAGMALLLWWYHHMRGRPYDLFSFNKSLAIAQVIGLCVGVALGPLCRFALGGERWIGLRRPICILAVMGLVAHGTIAFFFLPKQFPWKLLHEPLGLGHSRLTALTGLLALWALSYPACYRRLGRARGNGCNCWSTRCWPRVSHTSCCWISSPTGPKWFRTFELDASTRDDGAVHAGLRAGGRQADRSDEPRPDFPHRTGLRAGGGEGIRWNSEAASGLRSGPPRQDGRNRELESERSALSGPCAEAGWRGRLAGAAS